MATARSLADRFRNARPVRIARKKALRLAGDFVPTERRKREETKRAFAQMSALEIMMAAGTWSPHYEELLRYQYSRLLGRDAEVIFDIGAHGGLHTARFLELVGPSGKVVAFEPLPDLANALVHKFADPRLVVENRAVADFVGTSKFVVAEGDLEESGLRQRQYNRPDVVKPREIEVSVVTLDGYTENAKRLDFVKIDVEGAEIACLRGARQVVQRFRPLISIEYGAPSYRAYGHESVTLFDLASELDMLVVDLFGNAIEKRDDWRRFCDRMYWDYFLVPREKRHLTERLRAPI